NGGFSQFVYNSRRRPQTISYVRQGLIEMLGTRHLKLFDESAGLVSALGQQGLDEFFASGYFGENTNRDNLSKVDKKFFALCDKEDLVALNAAWLRRHPKLIVLPRARILEEIRRRASALPDREQRIADALANEPRYKKIIRTLCKKISHEFKE